MFCCTYCMFCCTLVCQVDVGPNRVLASIIFTILFDFKFKKFFFFLLVVAILEIVLDLEDTRHMTQIDEHNITAAKQLLSCSTMT